VFLSAVAPERNNEYATNVELECVYLVCTMIPGSCAVFYLHPTAVGLHRWHPCYKSSPERGSRSGEHLH
jgi:hypothetical protein